jgi:hypothetical protein
VPAELTTRFRQTFVSFFFFGMESGKECDSMPLIDREMVKFPGIKLSRKFRDMETAMT